MKNPIIYIAATLIMSGTLNAQTSDLLQQYRTKV